MKHLFQNFNICPCLTKYSYNDDTLIIPKWTIVYLTFKRRSLHLLFKESCNMFIKYCIWSSICFAKILQNLKILKHRLLIPKWFPLFHGLHISLFSIMLLFKLTGYCYLWITVFGLLKQWKFICIKDFFRHTQKQHFNYFYLLNFNNNIFSNTKQ